MSILSFLSSPWAIEQGAFHEVAAFLQAYHGKDSTEIEASFAALLAASQRPVAYAVDESGVAVLNVSGLMTPKLSWLSVFFGGTSTQDLAAQLDAMARDPAVASSLVIWDSPGGSTYGVPEAGAAMRRLAAAKPTASLVRGLMASAAYWVGSAARAVYVEGATDMVGSIGVAASVGWNPKSENRIDFVRGRYKRASINGEGPTSEFVQQMEAQLDELYSSFLGAVAKNRGTTVEDAHARMGDGRTFLGRQALSAGLVDGEMNVAAAIDLLANRPKDVRRVKASASMGQHSLVHTMDKGVQPLLQAPPAPPTAVAPAPVVAEPAAPALTRAEVVANCKRRAARDDTTFLEALKQVDPTGTLTMALDAGEAVARKPLPMDRAEREALASEARDLAAARGIPYLQALNALGY